MEYGYSTNIGISTDSAFITKIENSVIQESYDQAMVIAVSSLHLVELDNVTFVNNPQNRIYIRYHVDTSPLIDNATLTAQPGLEGYEVEFFDGLAEFFIPTGVTLTLMPDVTFLIHGPIIVNGRLDAIGTPSQPITFTSSEYNWGLYIVEEGSTHLNHTVLEHGYTNVDIRTIESAPISKIENSVIQDSYYQPISINANALHLVELDNVTFVNNPQNRIYIQYHVDTSPLIDNVTLTAQPGLEGYEVGFFDGLSEFFIPTGATLTVEPGITLFMPDGSIEVSGRLEAIGTPTHPITFTSKSESVPGGWEGVVVEELGSMHLNHVVAQYGTFNIGSFAQDDAPISKIENTVTQFSDDIGMVISDLSLHLVELDNVTFQNNDKNRVTIEVGSNPAVLLDDATLSAQPGLEGYEFSDTYPYMGTFIISSNVTLTVEPGISVFMEKGNIEVNGGLEAIGTPSQPITFTSIATNTYPWRGITANGGSTNLVHTRIQQSIENGLSILDGSVSARCSTFTNNLGSGIFVDATAQGNIQLTYNSLESNTVAGLQNEKPAWLDARYTWWGAADGPSGNGSGSGDAATGNVFVTPWLTAPECQEEKPPIWQVFLPVIITSE